MANDKELIYGIDLGTTNSCIALVGEDGEPHVLENYEGFKTTPSVVYYDDMGNVLVGDEAKRLMNGDAEHTVAFIKREIGNKNYNREIYGEKISPLVISSMILKKMVADANDMRVSEGLEPIHKAVITVPAYFGSTECEITRQAGEIAGIEVVKLIPEPTAAAISYGTKDLEGKTFMVYDLGGGTFDISIMRVENGQLQELANDGDHHLGGVDWDVALANYAFQLCGIAVNYEEIQDTPEAGRIILNAEQSKRMLSRNSETNMKFNYKHRPYVARITRDAFEDLMSERVDDTIMLMRRAIKNSRTPLTADDIQEIILVGGSSYMPMIKKAVEEAFPKAKIRLDRLKPDLAVAEGAAIYASTGVKVKMVSPCSYGIGCFVDDREVSSHLINKGDPYGTKKNDEFSTRNDNQTSVLIRVYSDRANEHNVPVSRCAMLASKPLEWGKPVPKNTPVYITFHLTESGILKIYGECGGNHVVFDLDVEGASQAEVEEARKTISNKTI
ncbi:MAG: Hsp70 family protein [Muribaculaceae bacterium]